MPGILNPQIEKYLNQNLPKRDPILAEMERYAQKHNVPIIGPACGRLLFQLTQISGAKRIFEMGSAIGYTALWFARAAGPGSEIFFTDSDPANVDRAKNYIARAGVAGRVHFLLGEAVSLIDTVPGEFDVILVDVFKRQYPAALEKSIPRLRTGGLLITDNVLWSGRVARASKPGDKDTRAIQKFNKMIFSAPDLFSVIVPLRDGVAVCRKS
jgi:caffeoyl-CoA O-methyltransferase